MIASASRTHRGCVELACSIATSSVRQAAVAAAGRRSQLTAEVVDAGGVARAIHDVQALCLGVADRLAGDLGREAIAGGEDRHGGGFWVLGQSHVDDTLKLAAVRRQHTE